ncbi:MAG: RpiB/LacA/LacB family sugar-phosphate isomerase [Prolixibacteraceae bacterium]|jgi:ribose 5-phosphate isomerase B|nr:RpiB/LacA/LacB family sugar-phosphate isomerase [Prolixibacteraceae bacterium]
MNKLKIALASDHAGYERKQVVIKHLKGLGIEIKDFGAFSAESTDYADWAHPMASAVENEEFDFGISLCGSGNGINMTVNKHQGIRSALSWTPEIAVLGRKHNDANILALPARFVTDQQAIEIVDAFLNSDFEGGRHEQRIKKIPLSTK